MDTTFGGTWPYTPNYFESDAGKIHYIDEGNPDSEIFVCLHGNPTWGYLYRSFVDPLVKAGY